MRRVLPLVGAAMCFACSSADDGPGTGDPSYATDASSIVDGSPLGVGALHFLNDETTTLAVLDDDVPLHRTAAENLVAHRDGPDGELGTSDDDPFDDLDEVLAVPQVGAKRLDQIAAYALAHGFVPEGDELLGVYDGVSFTVNEAEATLVLANTATETALDDDIGLDRRAVESILEARAIESIKRLAGLYFVGTSALEALKAAAGISSCSLGELPAPTGYTAGCTDRIASVITALETDRTSVWTTQAAACEAGDVVARFAGMYIDYWVNVAGVPEMVIGDEGPRDLRVTISQRTAGRVVSVDIGADEDRLDFVLDPQDGVLAYYQHNQSPDAAFHCARPGDSPGQPPDAECLGTAIIHFEDDDALTDQGVASSFSTHDPLVQSVVAHFRAQQGLGPSEPVGYDYALYLRPLDENGLAIELSSGATTTRYLAANKWGELPHLLVTGNDWACADL